MTQRVGAGSMTRIPPRTQIGSPRVGHLDLQFAMVPPSECLSRANSLGIMQPGS